MDWKKEYRVSDLFRREKAEKGPEPTPTEEAPSGSEPSVWKKEITVSSLLRRGKKADKPSGAAPEPPAQAPPADAPEVPEPEGEQTAPDQTVSTEAPPPPAETVSGEPPTAAAPTQAEEPRAETPQAEAEPHTEPSVAEDPVPPATADSPATPESPQAAEPSMWKKEIRVSDFLRRSKKERKAEDVPPVAEPSAEIPLAGAVAAGPESAAPSSGPTSQPDRDADTGAPPTPTDLEAPGQEDASTVGSAPAAGDATGAAAGSVWKKELKLSGLFSRKTQATGQVAGRTETKPPQREQREADRLRTETGPAHRGPSRPNGAAPLPDVPLVRALNLLPREEVKVRSGRPVLPYVGVGLLAALVVGALAVVFLNERSKIDDQQAQKEDLEAQIAALQAVEQTSPQEGIQLAGEALTRASALSTALDGRIVWDRFLRDLSLTLPEGVWFSAVTSTAATAAPDAAPTAPVITIGGYAKSQAGLAQLVSRLGVLPELASVQLQSGTVVTLGAEEVVQFTIIATAKQSTATAAPVSPTEVAAS